MGKASRKRRSDQRKQLKRAAKAQRRALYASLAGQSRRAKRQKRAAGVTAQRGNHAMLDCGNPGCERCYPQFRCLPQNAPRVRKAGKAALKVVA